MEGMRVTKAKGILDYLVIQRDLEQLFEAIANKLEREWPARYQHVDSARTIFFQNVRIAINTFNTIMWIVAEIPRDSQRRPSYALSVPSLTRSLFEQLIIFLFLLEDIPTYIPWLFKTDYTELRIRLEHYEKYHGSDPFWDEYIDAIKNELTRQEQKLHLTADEIRDPKTYLRRFPTPGGFLRKLRNDHPNSSTVAYIEYIYSWLYRELSGQTHLNIGSMIERGIMFDAEAAKQGLGPGWEEKRRELLEAYRVKQIYIAITFMLAITSEIEAHFGYGRNEKARYLWAYFSEYSDMTKDFWESRYRVLLPE